VKPAPFRYAAPTNLGDALSLLADHAGEAKLLAGGQSLVQLMNFRKLRPSVVIDLNRIPGLRGIEIRSDGVHIGAMTRYCDVERHEQLIADWPILPHSVSHIAHQQIRSRGTIGGSLAQNHPGAEMPQVLLALDAEVTLRSRSGERRLPVDELYRADGGVTIGADEILIEIAIPRLPAEAGWGFREVTRRHGDASVVAAAAIVAPRPGGGKFARISLAGAGRRPIRFPQAEDAVAAGLRGRELAEALAAAASVLEPPDTPFAPDWYRRDVAAALVARVVEDGLSDAPGGRHAH
jgi:carbon-monoxide dehydrogenase medium subunit